MMPIADEYRWSVAFLLDEDVGEAGKPARRPIGTGFFVDLTEHFDVSGQPHELPLTYLVTCAHVLRGKPRFVRVTSRDLERPWPSVGPAVDIELQPHDRWTCHPDPGTDVAVIPVDLSPDVYHFSTLRGSTKGSLTYLEFAHRPVSLGERVFFVGLLALVDGMVEKNVPMVRSGTLGALWQEGIPVKFDPQTTFKVVRHLIDCLAFGGFSGSPVFLHRDVPSVELHPERSSYGNPNLRAERRMVPVQKEREAVQFLGMFTGHFPLRTGVLSSSETEEAPGFEVDVNAGVGLVVPRECIWETLALQELVEDRQARVTRATQEIQARVSR